MRQLTNYCVLNKAGNLESLGFQGSLVLFRRIVTMAEFHKNGSKQPFLWNYAVAAARINRKAVYSVDINYFLQFVIVNCSANIFAD